MGLGSEKKDECARRSGLGYNVFPRVTDRDRVTDHPRSASYFSKYPIFATLPNLVTTGGLCITSNQSILCAGASSGFKILLISTEERLLSSISLPPPPMSTTSPSSVSSLLLSRFRGPFLILMHFFCALFEELGAVKALVAADSFLISQFLVLFSFLHLAALSPLWVRQYP